MCVIVAGTICGTSIGIGDEIMAMRRVFCCRCWTSRVGCGPERMNGTNDPAAPNSPTAANMIEVTNAASPAVQDNTALILVRRRTLQPRKTTPDRIVQHMADHGSSGSRRMTGVHRANSNFDSNCDRNTMGTRMTRGARHTIKVGEETWSMKRSCCVRPGQSKSKEMSGLCIAASAKMPGPVAHCELCHV